MWIGVLNEICYWINFQFEVASEASQKVERVKRILNSKPSAEECKAFLAEEMKIAQQKFDVSFKNLLCAWYSDSQT